MRSKIKIIILAYDFPPRTNTAAQRPFAWWKYMQDMGIYPIVITRNWQKDIDEEEITKDYAIYRISTPLTLQERYWVRTDTIGVLLRKFVSTFNPFLHTSFMFGPYRTFYSKGLDVLKSYEGKKLILATAMPFGMFGVAYKLHKKTGIDWVADYRDDWTTTELPVSFLQNIAYRYRDSKLEKRWLESCLFFTSVSDHYVEKISKKYKKKLGYTIENGFFEEEHLQVSLPKFEVLSFVYVGSLYTTQNIEPILMAIGQVAIEKNSLCDFYFLGTPLSEVMKSTYNSTSSSFFRIHYIDRLPKAEALNLQLSCHFAVMVPHEGLKGIPSSKMYEFIGATQPVLVYPNDHDIIYKNLTITGLGIFAEDIEELKLKIRCLFHESHPIIEEDKIIKSFSRKEQTWKLVNNIDRMI